jgi:hypothetical protein
LELAHDRIALHILIEPEKTVGDGEDGIIAQLRFDILPDQKSSCLPTGQEQAELLHEPLDLHFVFKDLANHRAEGIDDHDARAGVFNLFGDFCQYSRQSVVQQNLAQIDKADGAVQLGRIEKCILLLVTQHF